MRAGCGGETTLTGYHASVDTAVMVLDMRVALLVLRWYLQRTVDTLERQVQEHGSCLIMGPLKINTTIHHGEEVVHLVVNVQLQRTVQHNVQHNVLAR